ncbi:MAG TPA: HAD family phosphatase [Vicinamibacterales bacterium]|nr:HAD family phosphatase [Vicinamibacterales bacterium]
MIHLVFDFDGVLADSEPLHLATYQEVFAALGVTLTREDYYAQYLGYDDEGVFRAMAAAQGWDPDERRLAELIAQKSRVFDELIAGGGVIYPAVPGCIERLARVFPLGIASGALRHEIETILDRAGLARHFRFIVASGDTPNSKPAPDPYIRAAQLHGVLPAACVAIEDSRWGIVSARAAGMKCVGITNTYPASELTGADIVIESLEELTPAMIERL